MLEKYAKPISLHASTNSATGKTWSIPFHKNVSVSVLFGEKATNVIHENKGDNVQAQIGTVVQQDKEHIESLKEEIKFLRKILENR